MGPQHVHGMALSDPAGAAAAVAPLLRRNAGVPVAYRRPVARRPARHQRGALMRLSPTAKAAAVPSAGGSDSSRIGTLLTAAWAMAHRWKGRIFYAVLDQAFAS